MILKTESSILVHKVLHDFVPVNFPGLYFPPPTSLLQSFCPFSSPPASHVLSYPNASSPTLPSIWQRLLHAHQRSYSLHLPRCAARLYFPDSFAVNIARGYNSRQYDVIISHVYLFQAWPIQTFPTCSSVLFPLSDWLQWRWPPGNSRSHM